MSQRLFELFFTQAILCLCFLVFCQSQKANSNVQSSSSNQTSTVSIDAAYIRLDNLYCLGFSGNTCNQCYSTINYYLYGNQCVRFQDRDSDNSTTIPVNRLIRVCDDQCDSNSCQTTTSFKGLCIGCKYSSQSYTFHGYGFYNGNTSIFERCITDCDHFGQQFGEITTKGVGICSNCPSACESCSSKTLCIECSYRYQRYTGSSASNFSNQVLNTSNSSSQSVSCSSRNLRTSKSILETQGTLSRDYYITPKTRDSPCITETCQGTILDPFDDINLVFVHLLDKFLLGQKEEAVINIYLMKGKTADMTLDHFWKEQNLTSAYKRVFERTAVDVSIQPLVCNGSNITEGCYTSDEKANVILKSNKISFFITKTFTFKNIILDASELIPHSICYEENKNSTNRCCIDNGGTYPIKSDILLSNGTSNDAQCEPPKYSWGNSFLQVPWEAFSPTQDLWKKGPFAFFTMNFLRDYPKYIPTLVIEGCIFKNFWYHRYAYSFIYLDQRGSRLTINNTKFQNFYFPMGLVTNMQKLTQRNSFFTTNLISTAIADCTTYNSSLSNCHSLTVQNSIFEGGYFGNFTLTATDPDYYSNEGIVLSLQEFRGPILLQSNIFRKLASIKFSLVNNNGLTEGISAICSNPRASFNDSYRLSLDRHIQVVIGHESWSKKPLTSSVLSLRNLTHGFTLYNNTFTNNAAETGTALLIHNFKNTQNMSIIIEGNRFNQNFAKEFGTAIAILKYERDYINLQCKGVYLSNNTFEDNFGCPFVKGTVIVSCMPEKPYVSDMNSFYNSGSSSLQAYILGYFVSVNGVNSYKTKTGSTGTKSRFTDLQVSETDDLTQKVFSKFVRDITATKELINGTIHPIFGTDIDANRITSIRNTFIRNYAYHSHLFFQGAYNTLVKQTTFQDNSVPVPQFLSESLSSSINLFKKALGSASYWKAVETTPLMVRMSNYIVIQDSLFINNTQMLTDSLSLSFGAAITIDKHLGLANVSMVNNTFKNNWGWTSSALYQKVKDTIEETIASKIEPALIQGIQGTLITYNYWDYMYGIEVYDPASVPKTASGFYDKKTAIPYVLMDSCTFMNNSYNLSSDSQIGWGGDYRTAIIRYYNAQEGISLNESITNTNTNSYGTYVLYAKVLYTGCTFKLNVINDQRTFINPFGFNSLTIMNTTFESNTINDQENGYYSRRAYLYSYYNKDDSMASLTANNLTFRNNVGKLMYFEDEKTVDQTRSTTKYQISINGIKIENHVSSPDFLLHISRKQYIDLSTITAVNVSAKYGFLYLNAPRTYYTAASITVTQLNTSRAGCLYAKAVSAGVNLGNIICSNTFLEGSTQASVSLVDSEDESRDLTIIPSEIPVSGCFSLYRTDTLSLSNSICSSAVLWGSLFSEATNSTENIKKSLCIYSLGVNNLILTNFTCELASARHLLPVEKAALGFFKGISILKIESSIFASNVAYQTLPLQEGKTLVTDSLFFNNTATTRGSVFSADDNIILEINRTTFTSNTCDGCSGTIDIQKGTLKIDNSTFINNTADVGGAVAAQIVVLTITSSTFQGNNAKTLASVLNAHLCTIEMAHNLFEENTVTAGGATLYLYDGHIFLQNNTFNKNNATLGTRNLAVLDAKELTIDNCTFTDDGEDSLPQVKGGFILIRDTKGTITGSTFNNGRGNNGGAIYFDLKQKTNFLLKNSSFKGCRARGQGEAIYAIGISDSLVEIQDVYVSCGTLPSYRTNTKDLSAVYCNQVTCQISDTIFDPWYADVDSGNQLHLYKGHNHSLKRVSFTADCVTRRNCYRVQSSAFRIDEVQSLIVEDSIFQGWGDRIVDNKTKITSLGGAVRIEFSESQTQKSGGNYIFTNCTWKDNQAESGGAIYANGVMNITINGAAFANNAASKSGGGVYWGSNSNISNFDVKGTVYFMNNSAESGGAYYFAGRNLSLQSGSLLFSENQAKYGNDKASYAVHAQLIEDPDISLYTSYVEHIKASFKRLLESTPGERNRFLTTDNSSMYASGENLEPPMVLKLIDEFGQHVVTDNKSTVKAIATSVYGNNLVVDGNPFFAKNGYVILYPLKVYVGPGSNVTFSFSLTSFSPAALGRASENFISLYTPSSQTISVRKCVNGERVSDSFMCVACETGKYTSLYNSTNQCQNCPIGGVCLGYDKFGPGVNYFRLRYSTNTLLKCLNDEACKGAVLEASEATSLYCKEQDKVDKTFCYTGWCSAGYQGNLCAECQDGYGYRNSNTRTCSKCSNSLSNYLLAFGIGILGICYIIVMIKTSLREDKGDLEMINRTSKDSHEMRVRQNLKNGAFSTLLKWKEKIRLTVNKYILNINKQKAEAKDAENVSLTSIYMKIFTNNAQLLAIVGTFRFDWPTEIIALFDVEEQISKSSVEIFSFDCFLRQPIFEKVGLNSFFSKLLIMSLSPIVIIAIIVLIWILIYSIKYKCDFQPKQKRQLKTNIIVSIVVVLFILHPSIVELSAESFKCVQLGDSSADLYLEGNLEIKCWDSTHLKWALMIGLPSLIFWGLGIPIGALFVLYHNRKSLHLGSMKARYGFLYEGFSPNTYYWEFVIFYRKMILIIVSVFMSSYSAMIQVTTYFDKLTFKGAIVLGISAVNYVLQERVNPYLTKTLNELEKKSLIATGLTVYIGFFYLTDKLSRGVKILFLVVIFLINLYFFVFFVVELIKVQASKLLKIKIMKKRFGRCLEAIAEFEWKFRQKRVFSENSQGDKKLAEFLPLALDKDNNSNIFESNFSSSTNQRLIQEKSLKGDLQDPSPKVSDDNNRKYVLLGKSQSECLQIESYNNNISENWQFYGERSIGVSKEFQGENSTSNAISKSIRMLQKLECSSPYSPKDEISDSEEIGDLGNLLKRRIHRDSIFKTDFPKVINVKSSKEEDQEDHMEKIDPKQVSVEVIEEGVDKKESGVSFKELKEMNQEEENEIIGSILFKNQSNDSKKGNELLEISKIFEEYKKDIVNEESLSEVNDEPGIQEIKKPKKMDKF